MGKGGLREPSNLGHGVVGDYYGLGGLVGAGSGLLDRLYDVQAHMLVVEPLSLGGTDEELRFICARATGSLLIGVEGMKVLGCAGSGVGIELYHDLASGLGADLHVEENLRV
jgi:hypothetical protein